MWPLCGYRLLWCGGDQFGERRLLERAHDRTADACPEDLRGADVVAVGLASAADRPVGEARDAFDRGDSPLERLDHLGHRDLCRLAGEQVAAVGSAAALDATGAAQARHEMLGGGEREPPGAR